MPLTLEVASVGVGSYRSFEGPRARYSITEVQLMEQVASVGVAVTAALKDLVRYSITEVQTVSNGSSTSFSVIYGGAFQKFCPTLAMPRLA